MDIKVIEEHTRKCVGRNSSIETEKVDHQEQLPAVLNANGLKKMLTHRSKFLTATDEMAYANREEFGNFVTVLRASYIDDAIRLSKCPFFISKVKKPIIVSFSGEVGLDGGGLRRNFLSMIMDYGVRVFERLGTEVGLDTADVDDIHFMLFVFLGLAIIQATYAHKLKTQT